MTDRIFLGHTTEIVSASVVRPDNTTAYDAGDVIGTAATHVLAFEGLARSAGGAGMISAAIVVDSANLDTKPSLELWLFRAAPAAQGDNGAFAPTDAELAAFVGIVQLTDSFVGNAGSDAAGNCVLVAAPQMLPFKCATGSSALYGVLVVRNAYTPVSGEEFTVILTALQDY